MPYSSARVLHILQRSLATTQAARPQATVPTRPDNERFERRATLRRPKALITHSARRGVTRRKQIYLILKPGGYMLWHTPFMFPFHGVPADYFRYTHAGAAAVCEDAGL